MLQRNKKIDIKQRKEDVKKPAEKRLRRSFVKPNLKVKNKKKTKSKKSENEDTGSSKSVKKSHKHHNAPIHGLYNLLFSRLLLIDDNTNEASTNLNILKEMSISSEYTKTHVPSDGILCVENSMRENRLFEAVFLDGFMPGTDGPTVAKKLRSLGYGGIILGMCCDGDGIDCSKFISQGANVVLTKPLNPTAVREALILLTPIISSMLETRKNRMSYA